MKMIIGLSGKKASGKSTVANYLTQTHRYKELSFADPLKRGCKEIFGLTDLELWG